MAYKIPVYADVRPQTLSSDEELDMSVDQIDQVSRQLAEYANIRDLAEPLSGASWSEVLIDFFARERFDRKFKRNVTKGRAIIASPIFTDHKVVADFIRHHHDLGSEIYKIIEKIYYGVLVTDFLTKIQNTPNDVDARGLQIVYDAPVLMRLVGFCGRIIQKAAREMHDSLAALGCEFFYYGHSYNELLANVDYIITQRKLGEPLRPETEEAFRKGELSIADLTTFKTAPDRILYSDLGATEHPASYEDRSGDEHQIDEVAFKNRLGHGGIGWGTTKNAAEADAASLALTLRLRRGKSSTDLFKSGTIFVTHNTGLVRHARVFLKENGLLPARTLNPFQTMTQVTTIAWLAKGVAFDSSRVSAQLIADCYSAAVPEEGWNQELLNKVAQYGKDEISLMLTDALFSSSIRQIASEKSLGNVAILRSTSTADVVRDAREAADKIREEERGKGFAEGKSEALGETSARLSLKAKTISDKIGRAIVYLVLASAGYLLLESVPGVNLPLIDDNNIAVIAVAIAISLWSLVSLMGLAKDLSLQEIVSRGVFKAVRKLQVLLVGTDPNEISS
ncbi:hypothetical protein [Qipengyuania sp. JC766]|uniref:hypothetical protein n=1 Tax=Qipengyuania sp. JC766 TaxID=3232139 RepID=UPI0034589448